MDIKTCPHCNGVGYIEQNYSHKLRCYFVFVKCDVCGAQGKIYRSDSDAEFDNWDNIACRSAVMAWNLRNASGVDFDRLGAENEDYLDLI